MINNISTTKIIAKTGSIIETTDIMIAIPVSKFMI